MALWIKVLVAKAYDLSSIPVTHMIEEKRNSHPNTYTVTLMQEHTKINASFFNFLF